MNRHKMLVLIARLIKKNLNSKIVTLAFRQNGQYDFDTITTGVEGIASLILVKVGIVWMDWQFAVLDPYKGKI